MIEACVPFWLASIFATTRLGNCSNLDCDRGKQSNMAPRFQRPCRGLRKDVRWFGAGLFGRAGWLTDGHTLTDLPSPHGRFRAFSLAVDRWLRLDGRWFGRSVDAHLGDHGPHADVGRLHGRSSQTGHEFAPGIDREKPRPILRLELGLKAGQWSAGDMLFQPF